MARQGGSTGHFRGFACCLLMGQPFGSGWRAPPSSPPPRAAPHHGRGVTHCFSRLRFVSVSGASVGVGRRRGGQLGHATGHRVAATLGRQSCRGPRCLASPAPFTHARPLLAWTRAAHGRPRRVSGINKACCVLCCGGEMGMSCSLAGHLSTTARLLPAYPGTWVHSCSARSGHILVPARRHVIKEGDAVVVGLMIVCTPPRPCPGCTLLPGEGVCLSPATRITAPPDLCQATGHATAGIRVKAAGRVVTRCPEHYVAFVRCAEAQLSATGRHQLVVGGSIHRL